MEKLLDLISATVSGAFAAAGYDRALGRVTVSNRPDLCQFQCNGAMPAAKQYRKAPIAIANEVVAQLQTDEMFSKVEAVNPGFINLNLSETALADYVGQMKQDSRFGVPLAEKEKTIVIDYGGPNVAKPLHVGHLRSAIIGESIKRIYRYFGHKVTGDIHMGDWGLQMGLIIAEVQERHPELPYFDDNFTGEYPKEAPFTISELEEIYPAASAKSKEDAAFAEKAHTATYLLQTGKRGYKAMWDHIMAVSVADLKKNYAKLNVEFDAWLGESDAQPFIEPMLADIKEKGLCRESEGALVLDVQEETDTKEVPPCILVKSDGATLYATTDLATLVQRERDFHPDKVLYVVDKRQSLHFEQVFRAARKAGIVRPETELQFLGFGTMNGKDGKPFKTREGGVMRLERLIREVTEFVYAKIQENNIVEGDAAMETAGKIALAALKYGDLSNLATKDYIFDLDRFSAFEGNTGPYILYTIVRIKSILSKYQGDVSAATIQPAANDAARDLMLALTRFADNLILCCRDSAPNILCAYIYELAGYANKFYHETKILTEEDPQKQAGYIALIDLTRAVLEQSIDLLGFSAPEKM
ncbi:MAG TPA: arginine--tRNA ligase [Candidatus Avoscillospira avistercoris]|uniref:Arginine--tRNA ligase n=1 Tax=Candidatus Avoscillospira avistercoris TaxID=2840707 RepID=A0A9D1F793_9FIRM|nr:arginine--tRNA ligase [Candidatus Avoscillospira avistercoris]